MRNIHHIQRTRKYFWLKMLLLRMQVVAPVNGTSSGSNVDVAGHLSGEQLAHRIMGVVLASDQVDFLLRPDVFEHLLAVVEELVEQESVGDEHGEEDHHQVEELTESKVEMISVEPGLELHEVMGDGLGVTVLSDDILQHVSLESTSPERARHLGESKAECEEEWDPEIVGSDWSISLGCYLALVNKASRGLALQMISHIRCAVDPAV